jgi:hypothetical protein
MPNRKVVRAGLNRVPRRRREALARLTSEWGSLDVAEHFILELIRERYSTLQPNQKITAELVELEKEQKEISSRKGQLSEEIVRIEGGSPPTLRARRRSRNALVQARNAVIRNAGNQSHLSICNALDFELPLHDGLPLGFPEAWKRKWRVESFTEAYMHKDCRPLLQKLISSSR